VAIYLLHPCASRDAGSCACLSGPCIQKKQEACTRSRKRNHCGRRAGRPPGTFPKPRCDSSVANATKWSSSGFVAAAATSAVAATAAEVRHRRDCCPWLNPSVRPIESVRPTPWSAFRAASPRAGPSLSCASAGAASQPQPEPQRLVSRMAKWRSHLVPLIYRSSPTTDKTSHNKIPRE
jgi:hypothetical protein